MTTSHKLSAELMHLNHKPCQPAVDWLDAQPVQEWSVVWRDCHEPRWMLWLIGRDDNANEIGTRRKIVLCACRIARTVEHLWKAQILFDAVTLAERWASGDELVALSQLHAAVYAATFADVTARDADAATFAVYAATCAADAACDAARVADAATFAVYAATRAADAACDAAAAACAAADTGADSYDSASASLCDIIREIFPHPPKVRRPRTANKETCNG